MSCWYKPCPVCDGQGRLEIMKNIDEDYLFFCCDECMSCWKNESDLEKRINKFMKNEKRKKKNKRLKIKK